jgi:S1-C subfamily serine protease
VKTILLLALQCALLASAVSAAPAVVVSHAALHNTTATAAARPPTPGYREAVRRVSASVVTVFAAHPVEETNAEGSREKLAVDLGSGVVLEAAGYIVTSNHIVERGTVIAVALADGSVRTATLVGSDYVFDLAVLKVDCDGLQPIVLGDSSDVEVGDIVLAVGNPLGLGQTVTQGIVSAKRRVEDSGESLIQTDAAINPGNSGGALVDTTGRLIGINAMILSRSGGSEGMGFAIPVDLVRKVSARLMAGSDMSAGSAH